MRRVPSSTSKKVIDDDATAARPVPGLPLVRVLGFPPVRYGGGEGVQPTPFRKGGHTRRRNRVGVKMTGISPDPQKNTSPDVPRTARRAG